MTESEAIDTLQYLLGHENAVDKGELDEPNCLNSQEKEALKIILEKIQRQRAKKPKKETYEDMLERLLLQYSISDYLLESVKDWLEYKIERNNFKYKEKGLNTLLRQISDTAKRNGDEAVANAIRQSIASGYQGIVWDKVSKGNQNRNGGGIDWNNV